MQELIYFKDKESAILSSNNDFIYEVEVYCIYPKYYSLINRYFYRTSKPIRTLIPYLYGKNYKIKYSLFAAPKLWLLNNEFELFVKKVKTKKKKDGNSLLNNG